MNILKALIFKYKKYKKEKKTQSLHYKQQTLLRKYFEKGQIPWSDGYQVHKEKSIIDIIYNNESLRKFYNNENVEKFGFRLDERIVEYPWIFSNIENGKLKLLDAGSTFNFQFILEHPLIQDKELTIFTYAPESPNFNEKKISYVYGDLRELPFKDECFDLVISQSTIEHIDMNNSIYGYNIEYNTRVESKSYEFLFAIKEMIRVLKSNGKLLITFPYGKFENHDFFQQFDSEMLERLLNEFELIGSYTTVYFKYLQDGWRSCNKTECKNMISYNPHTNKGKGDDGAAHCRSICCVKFQKN